MAEKVRQEMKNTFAKSRGLFALVVACSLLFVTGCASMPPKSGFLSDYSNLEQIHDSARLWNFVDTSGVARSRLSLRLWGNRASLDELARYDSVIVDPFVIRLNKHSTGNWVSPEKINAVTKAMHAEFVKSLSGCYTIVEEPGEGVARFRTALTDISPMFVYESADDIAALTWANSKAAGSAFEIELVDSVSKEQMAAMVGKSRGGRFDALDSEKDPWEHAADGLGNFGKFLCERRKQADASN